MIQTINPANGKVLKEYSLLTQAALVEKINQAFHQFQLWRKTSLEKRRQLMLSLASCLETREAEFASLIAHEMGKPIQLGQQEIRKCVWVCRYYAEQAENYLRPHVVETKLKNSFVCYEPLGVLLAIMPWNFPFWQVFRFAAPNLMGGNVLLLRHAPITTGCGEAIESLFLEAGFPKYTFQHLVINNEMTADVIAHDHIVGVTLTGSEQAGRIVAANAAAHLKKTVLELGGSDAYIVLADADLDKAAKAIVASRLNNTGQTCISAKRVIVVEEVMKTLLEKILHDISSYKMGDPLDPQTQLGPLARADLRDTLHSQVTASVSKGAQLLMGGTLPSTPGFYYPITVLANVQPGMPAFDEELFGPVFAMITAQDESHAIVLANQSRFGLGSAVFTQNIKRGQEIAMHEIQAGSCYVNGLVGSDPRLPFGGIKHSGYGRELAKEGFLEFMNGKTVGVHE